MGAEEKRNSSSNDHDQETPRLHGQELEEAVRQDLEDKKGWNKIMKKHHVGGAYIKRVRDKYFPEDKVAKVEEPVQGEQKSPQARDALQRTLGSMLPSQQIEQLIMGMCRILGTWDTVEAILMVQKIISGFMRDSIRFNTTDPQEIQEKRRAEAIAEGMRRCAEENHSQIEAMARKESVDAEVERKIEQMKPDLLRQAVQYVASGKVPVEHIYKTISDDLLSRGYFQTQEGRRYMSHLGYVPLAQTMDTLDRFERMPIRCFACSSPITKQLCVPIDANKRERRALERKAREISRERNLPLDEFMPRYLNEHEAFQAKALIPEYQRHAAGRAR
jgi:hypothetical protein